MMTDLEALDILRAQGHAAGTPDPRHGPRPGMDSRNR